MTDAKLHAVVAADYGAVSPRAERPRRRSFAAEYKLKVLAEYEAPQPPRTRTPAAAGDLMAAALGAGADPVRTNEL
ncbi:hypothetical protein [Modestobacter sp. DSM 44400]|uniref:hypothetical protein n=1 Tax=Modestobacter sp. DSM 44400 TaxID=1550230 RepID=UPI00111524CD|nr:hypothetical protein [Modestobacter sp. DSM 44400]